MIYGIIKYQKRLYKRVKISYDVVKISGKLLHPLKICTKSQKAKKLPFAHFKKDFSVKT